LLTETALLAVIGGIAGAAIADVAVPLVARLVPDVLPVATAPAVDGRILLFAGLVTFCMSIAVGVLPALRPSRTADPQSLRSRVVLASSARLRSALVVTARSPPRRRCWSPPVCSSRHCGACSRSMSDSTLTAC
jgi:hypothetical protein